MHTSSCPLCDFSDSPHLIYLDDTVRVIDAAEPDFPGFTRVVWNRHVSEMTDLSASQRQQFMDVVWAVEHVLRQHLLPLKVNVAQLGNQVPHLHWHIIPRWALDPHFPNAIWAAPAGRNLEQTQAWKALRTEHLTRVPAYHQALRETLTRG